MSESLPANDETAQLLTKKAWGDFVHDFDDTVRANVTVGILNQIPIESTMSIKGLYGKLLAKIQQGAGKPGATSATAFQMFRQYFPVTLPRTTSTLPSSPLHETEIVNLVDIPYAQIVSRLHTLSGETPQLTPEEEVTLRGRNYGVQALPEKLKGTHFHLVSCLKTLTGVNSFILMWDAGSCEISEIGSTFDLAKVIPGFNINEKYIVYILNSKGNLSDPAPKPTIDTLSSKNDNIELYFLEEVDPAAPTVYPIWQTEKEDPRADVYSGYTFTTRRTEGKRVSATLRTPGGTTIDIADVKESSKVANAVANAVFALLIEDPVEKIMAYFLLKRMGDWCQAVDLRDTTQKYRIRGQDSDGDATLVGGGRSGEVVTLADLQDQGAIPILITNDRILLAYAVALGLNVIFTTVRALANWLVYFHNKDSGRTDDRETVLAAAAAALPRVDALLAAVQRAKAGHESIVTSAVQTLSTLAADKPPDLSAFCTLRDSAFVLARLPRLEALASLKQLVQEEGQRAMTPQDIRVLRSALGKLRSALATVSATEAFLPALLPQAGLPPPPDTRVYPDAEKEVALMERLSAKLATTGLSTISDDYIQFQNLVERLASDARGTRLSVTLPDDAAIRASRFPYAATRASRAAPSFTSLGLLYGYVNRTMNPPAMTGGVRIEDGIGPYLQSLLQFAKTIRPYTLDTTTAAYITDREDFIAKDKNFIRLLTGKYTTVVDGFLAETFTPSVAKELLTVQTTDPQSIYAAVYGLLKCVLASFDDYYNRLLELQTVEYSSPDALTSLGFIEKNLDLLGAITTPIFDTPVLTQTALQSMRIAIDTWTKTDVGPTNPDTILQQYESVAGVEGTAGNPLDAWLTNEYMRTGQTVDKTFYILENRYHAVYTYHTARTLTKLLTDRDYIVEAFSKPLFQPGASTLLDFSRFLENIDPLQPNAAPTAASAIEKAITDAAKGILTQQAGGSRLRIRRALYGNARTPSARHGLYAGLRKRTGSRTTARVRQRSSHPRTWRQRKHLDRL